MRLVPFVFGHGPWIARWRERFPCGDDCDAAVAIDVLDDDSKGFFDLVNVANARAFGDMGMPAWVQLDCATLPTAMVGFAARRATLEREGLGALVVDLAQRLGLSDDALDDDALVPVAEYCALPTPEVAHVVGFSLFSLVPGLGLRAKAAGLFAMQARAQSGVTQTTNTALKTHCRLGPLVVEKRGVRVHSKPGTTLVYQLQVPPPSTLAALATGAITRVPFAGATTKKTTLDDGDVLVDVERDGFVVCVDDAASG